MGEVMPKAKITTKEGTLITVEGTDNEVVSIIRTINEKENIKTYKKASVKKEEKVPKFSATDLILSMREDGFFDKPKSLIEIKCALEEQGYFYPITTLSGTVLDLVRKRSIGRIKQGKKWFYVKR